MPGEATPTADPVADRTVHDVDPTPESDDAAPAGDRPTSGGAAPTDDDGEFGPLGRPFGRSPFLFGLLTGGGLITAYVAYLAIRDIWSLLILLFVSMFLAVALNPAVERLRKFGLPRGLAVAIVLLVGLAVVAGSLVALIPPLVQQGAEFMANLPSYIDNLKTNRYLNDLNERYNVIDQLSGLATASNVTMAMGGVLQGVGLVFSTLFNGVTVALLTVYFLVSFERLKSGAYRFVPASRRPRVERLGNAILAKVGGYTVGALTIAALAGVVSAGFMLVVGIPYAFALAVVVALFDLIPQVGATLGAVVVTLVGFAQSVPVGIACLVFFVLYQQLENWVIYPRVMRRTVQVSDLAAIVSMLIGASLLGVVGVMIAIPVVAAVQLIIREVVFPRQQAR
jgi:predicted PurR-regulated permease PerM